MPLLIDLQSARRGNLLADGTAGTVTAILLIPQALAYALLAGLPPEVGLYASVLPMLVYALIGSSRTLSVGPVAVAAVMVTTALTPYAQGDAARYLSGALILAALSGLILLGMAALRLGWLTHFISHPVLSGFTTGAALFIIGTQLPALSGIAVPRDAQLPGILAALWQQRDDVQLPVAGFGLAALALLLLARQPLQRVLQTCGLRLETAQLLSRAAPLLVVAGATGLSAQLDAEVPVVGAIPQGLPGLSLAFLSASGCTHCCRPP